MRASQVSASWGVKTAAPAGEPSPAPAATFCLVCGGDSQRALEVSDTRFGIEGTYAIRRCATCGLEQTFPPTEEAELNRLYEKHYNFQTIKRKRYDDLRNRFFSSNLYRLWLWIDGDVSFHRRKGAGRLLDIGCNDGRSLKRYADNGLQPEGLEINPLAAGTARKTGFTVHNVRIEDFAPAYLYDVAVLSNVLEHSLDPTRLLLHVRRILKPGGEVWLSCPNSRSWLRRVFGAKWINWHVPFHIVHFSPKSLARLLSDTSFFILENKQATPALWAASSVISALFSRAAQPTVQLRSRLLVAGLTLAMRFVLFPFLFLANHFGHGDCLVVVVKKT